MKVDAVRGLWHGLTDGQQGARADLLLVDLSTTATGRSRLVVMYMLWSHTHIFIYIIYKTPVLKMLIPEFFGWITFSPSGRLWFLVRPEGLQALSAAKNIRYMCHKHLSSMFSKRKGEGGSGGSSRLHPNVAGRT